MKIHSNVKIKDLLVYGLEKRLMRVIHRYNPHMIVLTNPMPLMALSGLKRRRRIHVPIGTVITDYTAHKIWINPVIDQYFVGSEVLRKYLIQQGISPLRIAVTGIPIHEKFNLRPSLETLKAGGDLELLPDLPTVLIMGGGEGLGPVKGILKELEKLQHKLQLLVVLGKNEDLLPQVKGHAESSHHEIKVFGFTHQIHQMMEASSLLISKAGGITMTEALCKELPTLIVNPIPGQEVYNARYLEEIGVATLVTSLEQLSPFVDRLLFQFPERLEEMKQNCSVWKRPYGAEMIGSIVLAEINAAYYRENTPSFGSGSFAH